jgi:hypothetical protein
MVYNHQKLAFPDSVFAKVKEEFQNLLLSLSHLSPTETSGAWDEIQTEDPSAGEKVK